MMQHAARLDDVKGSADRAELEDVGLGIFEVGYADFAGLAQRIGKTCQAEIDRQRSSAQKTRRGLDRLLPGATARNQHVEIALAEVAEGGGRELVAHVLVEPHRLLRRIGLRPARIGIFLVLLLHLARDIVLDRRKGRNLGAQFRFRRPARVAAASARRRAPRDQFLSRSASAPGSAPSG